MGRFFFSRPFSFVAQVSQDIVKFLQNLIAGRFKFIKRLTTYIYNCIKLFWAKAVR